MFARSLRSSLRDRRLLIRLSLVVKLVSHKFERSFVMSTNKKTGIKPAFFIGGYDKTRTCDLYDVNVAL